MTDFYQTLGVNETASQDEIQKAYRKLAMKNHPDRGGDTNKFQEISQAYDTLSDPDKRAQYDAHKNNPFAGQQGFNPFTQGSGPGFHDIHEMFQFHFGPGFANFGNRQTRRNRDLTIRVSITLKQSYTGTQLEASYNTPSGKRQTVVVNVPPGISSGQTVRYQGLGDDSFPGVPRGDLNVQVFVEEDNEYERRGNDLIRKVNLTFVEAMGGCTKNITCFDDTVIPITFGPGTQHGIEVQRAGKGFRDINSGYAGNFIAVANIQMPAVFDPKLKKEIEDLYVKIVTSSR